MKLSEKLLILADWLEHSENDLLINASNENELSIVAASLVKAADAVRDAAETLEPEEMQHSIFTEEKLDEMAAVAAAFDASGDELLQKQASVLDEILFTFAAPKNTKQDFLVQEDNRILELKKKYKDIKPQHDEMNKVSDAVKAIENSKVYKTYRPLETQLSTRSCPDHPGGMLARVGEGIWQCLMDRKVYDYNSGFKTMEGNTVPGGSVEEQTPNYQEHGHTVFDTRDSRLGQDGNRSE